MMDYTKHGWAITDDCEIITQKGRIATIHDTYDGLEEAEFWGNAAIITMAPKLYEICKRLSKSNGLDLIKLIEDATSLTREVENF